MKLGIHATRIGGHACRYVAADVREGCIASTFRHGFNVIFEEEVAPIYISIQTPEAPLHPWTIEVPAIPSGIDVGAPAHVIDAATTASTERTPGTQQTELASLTIQALHAPCHELHIAPYSQKEAGLALTRLPILGRLLDQAPMRKAFDPLQQQVGGTLRAWQASDDPATFIELVGLGSGSTPSGDDALVGILAGRTALSEVSASAKQQLEALREGLPKVRHRTHPASWQMLVAAGDGSFQEPLLNLARAMASVGPAVALSAAAARVLTLGATSGRSFLLGLLAEFERAAGRASGRRRRGIRKRGEPHSLKQGTPA